jgi:hypothetical protein
MVGKKRTLSRAITRVLCGTATGVLSLQALPALAQDEGDRANGLIFGVEQSLEAGRNLGLAVPAEGTSTIATTRLSLSYFDSNAVSRFSFDVNGVLRLAKTPGTDESGFGDPGARLSYTRAGANASLSVTASADQSDLTFDRDIGDFIGEDGSIDLPDDFDLSSTGQRNNYALAVRLDLQRRAPLSYSLGASYDVVDYANTTDPDLVGETTIGVEASASLRLSAISSASVALGYDDIQEEDTDRTHRKITTLTFGYDRELSPRARMGATLGLTHTDREILGPIRSSEDAATADVSLTYDLPTGALGGRIGVTLPDGGGTELIGELNWRQDFPTGSLTALLTQEADTTSDGETRPTTALSVSYTQDINALSGIEFGLTHLIASGTATRNRVAETQLAVTYNRSLTADWALRTGLSYQTRDEDTVGRSSSPFAFLSISRSFDLR